VGRRKILSSQGTPGLFRYRRHRNPPAVIILIVFVALLILFLWLHFIMAQQIESVGREIQAGQEKLDKIRRENAALQGEIATMDTQKKMAERAEDMNYEPQQPLYLLIDQPPGLSTVLPGDNTRTVGQVPASSSGAGQAVTSPP
jgi:predicted PurR-regulated permease PerM